MRPFSETDKEKSPPPICSPAWLGQNQSAPSTSRPDFSNLTTKRQSHDKIQPSLNKIPRYFRAYFNFVYPTASFQTVLPQSQTNHKCSSNLLIDSWAEINGWIVIDGLTDHLKILMQNCRATRECHVEYQKPVTFVKDIYAYYLCIFFLAAQQNKVLFQTCS